LRPGQLGLVRRPRLQLQRGCQQLFQLGQRVDLVEQQLLVFVEQLLVEQLLVEQRRRRLWQQPLPGGRDVHELSCGLRPLRPGVR
jgi:hypothetical protein